ncbi:MAG TPA: glutaredoxin [Solirubrobacteraceae bacterium]|nr:glutaredoxin [Solirubrobacteraceae bacterium]
MRTMQIYTKEGCQFSAQLRDLLEEREIPYEETHVKLDSPEHHELGQRAGSMKLPQAFVGVIPLGSAQEVQAAAISGMLDDLLVD